MLRSAESENQENVEEGINASSRFSLLLILGFAMVIVGIILILIAAALYGGSANAGAVIFIGPFPIVIGAGPDVTWIVLFSIILAVLSVVVFLIINRKIRRFEN
jgi:uncharacterized membrane protein